MKGQLDDLKGVAALDGSQIDANIDLGCQVLL